MPKRKRWPPCHGLLIRNRQFSQVDLVLIRRLIRGNTDWGRTRLSEEVCARLHWVQPDGRPKDRACRVALLKLEQLGFVELPPKKIESGGKPPRIIPIGKFAIPSVLIDRMPVSIELQTANTAADRQLWNAVIAEHHYLGLATPVGRFTRYLVFGDGKLLAAISFGEAAWALSARDGLLAAIAGVEFRESVVSNNRFLILPNVRVKNLATRILALATRAIVDDWRMAYGVIPRFVETFVDPSKFQGTCYTAGNWLRIGTTRGFAKQGCSHLRGTPKLLFIRGLNSPDHRRLAAAVKEVDEGQVKTRNASGRRAA